MALHSRKLKLIEFAIGAVQFECQIRSWTLDPGIPDPERLYSFCPDGRALSEQDESEPTLQLTFYSDWRSGGISDFLTANSGQDAAFTLNHHPGIAAEHVQWTGTVRVKAPPVGGEIRADEMTEITLMIVDDPIYTRVGA